MLENRKDTKAECATPLEYESPRKGHTGKSGKSGKSGTDPSPGPVYQDIQGLSVKANKVSKSTTSKKVPSDHNLDGKETKTATKPKDDSEVVRTCMIPKVLLLFNATASVLTSTTLI